MPILQFHGGALSTSRSVICPLVKLPTAWPNSCSAVSADAFGVNGDRARLQIVVPVRPGAAVMRKSHIARAVVVHRGIHAGAIAGRRRRHLGNHVGLQTILAEKPREHELARHKLVARAVLAHQ